MPCALRPILRGRISPIVKPESGDSQRGPVAETDDARYAGADGLRRAAARGSVVYGVFNLGLAVLGLLKGFLVAAFLTPTEYGIWGLLAVSLGTLLWLTQLGFDDKYIQQDDSNQEHAFQVALTLNCVLAAVFVALMLALLPLFALAYGTWEIVAPGAVLAIVAVPAAALQMPQWFYFRKMDFVKQRTLQLYDPIVSITVIVGLAIAGFGYWALVIGTIAGGVAAAIAAVRAAPYPMRLRWKPGALRSYVSFSWPLLIESSSATGVAQVSVLTAQNALGTASVGAIGLASTISQYTARVDALVSAPLYSAVCAAKDRGSVMAEAFSKSNRLALLWGVPCGVGIALFAPDLARFWLGEEWSFAVPVIQAFAIGAALNQICVNYSVFFRAREETRPMAVAGAAFFIGVMVIAIPLLLSQGIEGYAIGMVAATAVMVAVRIVYVRRMFPAFPIWAHTARAAAPTVPAAVALLGLRGLSDLDATLPGVAVLALLFGVLVGLATFVSERALIREVVSYVRGPSVAPLFGRAA